MTAVAEPASAQVVGQQAYPAARFDAGVRAAGAGFLWGSLALVGYWWAADGGLQDLFGGGESALNAVGRIAGLVASDLLLIQVLLIARIPLIERAFGQDRVVRLHRIIGFTSFSLLLVHIVTNTWGYAGASLGAIPSTFWNLTTTYPGMLLAVAGTLCLVMVVVTSVKAARRRLRYESWHLLHLYAYLGVGLALPHQLWTGQQFLQSRFATIYWWTFWAVAAASVLIFRVAPPLVDPGQFFVWRFLDRAGWTRGNPYSLSAAPDGRSLRISVKALGDNSASVAQLQAGTRIAVEGPYGRLSPRARTRDKVALIGAGVGIAPLRALAEGLDYRPGEAVLLYRFSADPLFDQEFAVLAAERGLRVVYLPGSRRSDDSWLGLGAGSLDDVAALHQVVPDLAARDVFVCGPQAWATAVQRAARGCGVPEDQLHVESFGW